MTEDIHITLTEEEFDKGFTLKKNQFDDNAGYDGCAFETYGKELDFVMKQDNAHIWTAIDGEHGGLCIVSGYHLVNRIYYLISNEPVSDSTSYDVVVD